MKCLYRLAGFQTDPPSLLKREKILSLDLNFGPQVCRYEACLASQMHLRTIGLPRLAESPSLGRVSAEVESKTDSSTKPIRILDLTLDARDELLGARAGA